MNICSNTHYEHVLVFYLRRNFVLKNKTKIVLNKNDTKLELRNLLSAIKAKFEQHSQPISFDNFKIMVI